MKRIFSAVLAAVGAALLVLGIALPTYIVPKGKVLPLNLVSTTGTAPTPGNLLDSKALAAGKPVDGKDKLPECSGEVKRVSCFIWKGLDMQSQRFTVAQEPSDKKQVTMELGQTLYRNDKQEPDNLLSATVDRVTLDRKTQMPVPDPVSTVNITPPLSSGKGKEKTASTAPFARNGIQYQWPMGTDKKSYPYFDITSFTTKDIDFVGEEEQDGVKVYRFEQTVNPTELYPHIREALEADGELDKADEATLAPYRLKFAADVWGIQPTEEDKAKAAEAKAEEKKAQEADKPEGDEANKPEGEESEEAPKPEDNPEIELSRFYTVNRTIWVEPRTGVIVNGNEEIWQYYARNQEEADQIAQPENRQKELENPTRTAMYYPGKWNDESKQGQMKKAEDGFTKMETMGKTVPFILIPVGLILLIVGFVLARGSRKQAEYEREV
ncbi:DUF3068 domain-containing protein [Corynebacterium sp. zg254]|uniref:DUF3068 domain-containing protein n=1 Tax=Corynebacterium zhongnanshanii TaxID=2768834 RepID=A0ABQ6VCY7_9CORY|nr:MULTISPECIES: DUF3068 domain-containing protein [Corynebacterium]KAB3519973.1 DUF3068 domain-containing protein [Corynebacterium zhongnanshanii]MCR5914922.1 DUF3068 domain-containing protein [Corynebacterium sp. zg254]